MGASGAGVFASDTAQDVREEWVGFFRDTQSAKKATDRVLRSCRSELKDSDDGPIVWLVLAALQMKYGCLEARVKKAALDVIDGGKGLDLWAEQGGKTLAARKATYAAMRKQLMGKQIPAKRPPRKETPEDSGFRLGDVVAVPVSATRRGFVKVCKVERSTYGVSVRVMQLDHYAGTHDALPNWDSVPVRWLKFVGYDGEHAGKVYGIRWIMPSNWRGRDVPRKAMVVVGSARVSAREKRAVETDSCAMPLWDQVPQMIKRSEGLGDPVRESGTGRGVKARERKDPTVGGVVGG